ncbi:hypothetical protein J6590_052129 [Homalodisca vitripennis]|nr:hypothetical protein J6590_052129 [Homalodisca vitripennis]
MREGPKSPRLVLTKCPRPVLIDRFLRHTAADREICVGDYAEVAGWQTETCRYSSKSYAAVFSLGETNLCGLVQECHRSEHFLVDGKPREIRVQRLSQDNQIKQLTAERSCPHKPACPAIGGGSEVTFKPLVRRLSVREGFLALTSPGKIRLRVAGPGNIPLLFKSSNRPQTKDIVKFVNLKSIALLSKSSNRPQTKDITKDIAKFVNLKSIALLSKSSNRPQTKDIVKFVNLKSIALLSKSSNRPQTKDIVNHQLKFKIPPSEDHASPTGMERARLCCDGLWAVGGGSGDNTDSSGTITHGDSCYRIRQLNPRVNDTIKTFK